MNEKKFLRELGNRIRALRKSHSLSQEELAELANLHPTYVGKMERATLNASILSFQRVARALKMPLSKVVEIPSKAEEEKDAILQKISARLRSKDMKFLRLVDRITDDLCGFVELPKKKRK
jgi:transcriptional regulator with XRE-family HTH domain